MATFERGSIQSPEVRRAALQERLSSFQRAVTEGVVVDETQDAEIKFTRTLTPDKLPKALKALLFVTGATSQNLRLEYAFAQGVNWEMPGIFSVKWDTQVENDVGFEGWPRDIKSIVVYVSEGKNKDWQVEFNTDDGRSYVEFDESTHLLKSERPQLFARLKVNNEILKSPDYRLELQEELVSLLDPALSSATLSYRQKEEDKREAEIEGMAEELMVGAREILGKE